MFCQLRFAETAQQWLSEPGCQHRGSLAAAAAAGTAVKDHCSQALGQLHLSTPASELTMLEEWELFPNIKGEKQEPLRLHNWFSVLTIVFRCVFLMKRLLNYFYSSIKFQLLLINHSVAWNSLQLLSPSIVKEEFVQSKHYKVARLHFHVYQLFHMIQEVGLQSAEFVLLQLQWIIFICFH